MEKKSDRRGLGRGLSALMADINLTHDDQNPAASNQMPRHPPFALRNLTT